MSKTAIIFGTTGQDGSYLAEMLLEKGYNVVGVKRRSSTNTTERLDSVIDNPSFSLIEGDIVDPSSVNGLVHEYQPDEIYNMAAQSHVHTSFSQPHYTFQVNTMGPLNILEAVRNYSPKSKVLHCSTSEMFGSNYNTDGDTKYQDENTTLSPNSPYAVSKVAAHELISLYRRAYGVFSCAAISFNHESPRRGEEFVTRKITKWIGDFVQNPNIDSLRLGNIDAVRDWSHAKDVVRGMWTMLQADSPKDYVLCSGKGYSVRQFLNIAFSNIGVDNWETNVIIDPKFYRPCEVEFLQGRYALAKKELGWEPEISFEELVQEMVEADIEKCRKKSKV